MGLFGNIRKEISKAVIYCRVSSDKQVRQGHGLEGQERRCREYAQSRGYEVVEVFHDAAVSGGSDDRPSFFRLMEFIESSDQPHAVIIDDPNRLARDVSLFRTYKLAILGAGSRLEGVNFEFDDSPENQLLETMVVAQGEYERHKNRERVIARQRARLQLGYWVFAPPKGYRYKMVRGHGKLLVVDPTNAPLIRSTFEKFASGELISLVNVAQFLRQGGLRNRSGQKIAPSLSECSRLLSRKLYMGVIDYQPWGIKDVIGHHEPIVDEAIFLQVQARIAGRKRAPRKPGLNQDFPLRGTVICGGCGTPLTASWSKGRSKKYAYYRCPSSSCVVPQKSIPKAVLEERFLDLLSVTKPTPGVLKLTRKLAEEVWSEKIAIDSDKKLTAKRSLTKLEMEIDNLVDQLVETCSKAVKARLTNRIEKLELQLAQQKLKIDAPVQGDAEFKIALDRVFSVLESPEKLWRTGNVEQQKLLQSLILLDPIEYRYQEGFGTALFSLPFRLLRPERKEKVDLVEAAGIEPASEDLPLQALHA